MTPAGPVTWEQESVVSRAIGEGVRDMHNPLCVSPKLWGRGSSPKIGGGEVGVGRIAQAIAS